MGHRQRGQSKIGLVIGVLVVAAIGGAAWYFMGGGGGGPEKAVTGFMAAQTAGDATALKAVLSKNSQAMAAGMGAMPKANKDAPQPTIGKAVIEGDKAKVPVTHKMPEAMAKMSGMTEMTMNFVTVKEDGAWKVDLMATGEEMMKGLGGMAGAMKGGMKGGPAGGNAPAPAPKAGGSNGGG
ncbi:MAG: DUF2950 family protein [Armatimonadetes bacterium]|nr:DUF2950 family protein [Armatimonadota bacterium]